MAGNPRIDDLRKRLEKDPSSRLFAQLAEELRKEGDFEDAIGACREGLQKHPNYPSARMTLGRALLDTGDLAAARPEFETVLKGAPDNILASRFLGECLEGLGDLQGALARYKATLALAPSDKQILARLEALQARLKAASPAAPVAAAPVAAAPAAPPTVPEPEIVLEAPEPPPIPLATVDSDTFELETSQQAQATVAGTAAPPPAVAPVPAAPAVPPPTEVEPPIRLVAAEESFELERPYEAPAKGTAPASPSAEAERTVIMSAAAAAPPPPVAAEPVSELDFDEALAAPETQVEEVQAPAVVDRPASLAPEPTTAAPPPPPVVEAPPGPARVVVAEPAPPRAPAFSAPPEAELSSATLAELYFNQGFTDKAIDVYRQLLEREPGNERARARLTELEALERHLRAEERIATPAAGPATDPRAARREAIERAIARLEGLLAAIKRG